MKRCILLVVVGLITSAAHPNNSNLHPIAQQESNPDRGWFYDGETVVFSSSSSYDLDGYVQARKWFINGTQVSTSTNYSRCFILDGSSGSGCYQLGSGVSTVTIKLEVQDNSGDWDSKTVVYTVQDYKKRKYFIKDHLGSVRTTVDIDGNVLGYDDYYPFGLEMPGRSSNSANPNDKYKFTGHERDDEAGLNLDYMGARYYDPAVPHFLSIDPLADQFPGVSPYVYAMNNPLKYTDPTGMAPEECCLVPFSTLGALAAVGKSKLDNSLGETGKIGYRGSIKYNVGGNVGLQANSLGLTLNAFSTDVIGLDVNIEYSSSEGLTGNIDLITPDGSIDQEFGVGVGPAGVSQSSSYTKTGQESSNLEILTGSDETTKAVEGGPLKLESITNNNTGQKTARVSAGLDYKVAFGHGFDASSRVYVQKDVKEIKEKIQNE